MSISSSLRDTPAIVLNSGPAGLAGVRSLGRVGIRVTNIDFTLGPGSKSRYCGFQLCPHPGLDPLGVIQVLLNEASRSVEKPVLFAASDQFFALLSDHREQLAPRFRMALPPRSASAAMLDKRQQYELALQAGIDCAKTIYPETAADVTELCRNLDYPAIIKPYEGHVWRKHFANKGFIVNSPEELQEKCQSILPLGIRFMVQSFILGPASNSYSASLYIAANGDCLASFTARKLRQFAVDAGVGTLVESLVRPELIDLGIRVCRMLHYHGIAEIEFKEDDRDGKLKFIELNPRLWVQAGLAASAGVDFATVQFMDLLGYPVPITHFRAGVRWLDYAGDYNAFRHLSRQGRLSPLSWIRSAMGARSFATFACDDTGPFYEATRRTVTDMMSKSLLKKRIRAWRAAGNRS